MLRQLGTRDGFTRFAITSFDDLDLPALLALIDEAWQADYADQVHPHFTDRFIRRLMADSTWVGILVSTEDGTPVGFELALERTLYCRQQPLRAYYATVFTVSSRYRRRGLGRWLLEGINHLVFDERQADLIFSTFHQGHAGSPTVQSTFDRIPDWRVCHFHTAPFWSRRLDRDPFPPLTQAVSAIPVMLPREGTHLLAQAGAERSASVSLPSVADFTAALRTQYEVAFGLDASFRTQYLHPQAADSGTLWYAFTPGASACVSYYLTPLIVNDRQLQPVGQLHSIYTHDCTPNQIESMLHHLGLLLHARGCFAMSLYDQGVIPPECLQRLGFHPSEDRYVFAVRGPRHAIDPFLTVRPPFFLDFT